MKVFSIIESSEFNNITLRGDKAVRVHWRKVQAARCHELNIFLHKLNKKYNTDVDDQWILKFSNPVATSHDTRYLSPLESWFERYVTRKELDKIRILYERMIMAKREYESFGGGYPNAIM